jgi:hypothetical protein
MPPDEKENPGKPDKPAGRNVGDPDLVSIADRVTYIGSGEHNGRLGL